MIIITLLLLLITNVVTNYTTTITITARGSYTYYYLPTVATIVTIIANF